MVNEFVASISDVFKFDGLVCCCCCCCCAVVNDVLVICVVAYVVPLIDGDRDSSAAFNDVDAELPYRSLRMKQYLKNSSHTYIHTEHLLWIVVEKKYFSLESMNFHFLFQYWNICHWFKWKDTCSIYYVLEIICWHTKFKLCADESDDSSPSSFMVSDNCFNGDFDRFAYKFTQMKKSKRIFQILNSIRDR